MNCPRRFSLFCFAFLFFSAGYGQSWRYYSGTINKKYPVYARLEMDSARQMVNGYYMYTRQKKEIILHGVCRGDSLLMEENDGEKPTGQFSGRLHGGDSITGIWDDWGPRRFPFRLQHISQESYAKQLPYTEKLDRIRYQVLKHLVTRFRHLPGDTGTFKRLQAEWKIPERLIRSYLFPENYPDELTEEEIYEINRGYAYYYGYVFFRENYLGLFVNQYFTPGAAGVNDYTIYLLTFDYFGNPIGRQELGCNCMDTNMGTNDYYQTEVNIRLETTGIFADITDTHATLFEEELKEGEKTVNEIKRQRKTYILSSTGEIMPMPRK